jgi:hypothetical protein
VNKLICLACFLVIAAAIRAADPSVEEKVKVIRARYAEIERDLKDCRQVKRDLPGESAEGGELTAWFKGRSLQKLSARFFGESGKALEEYYFRQPADLRPAGRVVLHQAVVWGGEDQNRRALLFRRRKADPLA